MRRRATTVALVAALALATTVFAKERESFQVFQDIQNQVNRYAFFTIFDDVNIQLGEEGIVTLTGSVTRPFKKGAIEKRVASVDGVTQVNNKIDVLPVSIFDDDLRYRLARAIYGNSSFRHIGTHAQPSVHIVVDGGHVTLTGVVGSEVDRALARTLAWQFGVFSVTNQLKTPDEVRADLESLS